jgi:hypothetical protein
MKTKIRRYEGPATIGADTFKFQVFAHSEKRVRELMANVAYVTQREISYTWQRTTTTERAEGVNIWKAGKWQPVQPGATKITSTRKNPFRYFCL